jgi:hypothetical protein
MLDRYTLDARSLAAFRIAVGLLLLWDLAMRGPELVALYSDAGAVPLALVQEEHEAPLLFRLFQWSGNPWATTAGFGVFTLAAAGLVVGRFTRTCTFVCWLLWCALMARNPYVINFGDRILRVALFWSIFLPLGASTSWDARRGVAPRGGVPLLPALALQIQIVLVYVTGAVHKSHPIWTTGQAVFYALQFDALTRPLGHALTAVPRVMEWLTYATLIFEGLVTPLVFSPWRTPVVRALVVAAAIGFHVGLGLTLYLGHFPAVCVAVWLPFVPGFVWNRVGWTGAVESAPSRTNRLTLAVVSISLVVVLGYNAATLRGDGRVPQALDVAARAVGLDQRWTMFAPHPSRLDGWWVVSGHRPDGGLVDVWGDGGPPRFAKPDDPAARFSDHRWMSFMVKLHVDRDRSRQKEFLADYLCRRWNADHPQEPIDRLAIDFVQELTLPSGLEDQPIRVPVTRRECANRAL